MKRAGISAAAAGAAYVSALVVAVGVTVHNESGGHQPRGKPSGVRAIHHVDHRRRETQRCRDELALKPLPVRFLERRTPSSRFRWWLASMWGKRSRFYCGIVRHLNAHPVRAIAYVWPDHLDDEAVAVVRCETGGTFSTRASNSGVYLGLFQFGPYARARYGFGSTALAQARAAYRYFRDAGWAPWECARIVGIA